MEHHFIYGYRTITRLLKKIHGLIVNRKKVYRIMKENSWLCRARPKKVPNIGQPYYVTENKLNREFQVEKPLEKLVTDITYLYFVYLSSVMDLYNREMVAYTISDCQDTDFVLDTLNQLELPKGNKNATQQQVAFIENWINNYPKRVLDYKSPRLVL
ncbi:hypothetical protein DEH83_06605 [Streptococcus constellatus]|nr:hypothetical protein DEH83_06605 [Streptococcus constellatus]